MEGNMGKKLSEMTNEELWKLFPIILAEHKEEWTEQYENMEAFLKEKLSCWKIVRISHIGSTAIKNICAKPIIDILVEIAPKEDMNAVAAIITENGFTKMSEDTKKMSFNHGYTENGFADKIFHLHLRFAGDNNELYFRDYFNEKSNIAKEYERLKLDLWHKFEHNRDGYSEAKTEFIEKHTMAAKYHYKNKYVYNDNCPCRKKKCVRNGNCEACRIYHADSKRLRPCEK